MTTETENFINALYGAYEGAIRFEHGDKTVFVDGSPKQFVELHPDARLLPVGPGGGAYIFEVHETSNTEYWKEHKLTPTAVLHNAEIMLTFWTFDEPVQENEPTFITLMDCMKMGKDEAIPLPGEDWTLLHCDPDTFYTLDELKEAFGDKNEIIGDPTSNETYGDAKLLSPYNEADYEQSITVTIGAKSESKNWVPQPMPLAALIAKLCTHTEGNKDGVSVVLADMVPGQRLKNSVIKVTGLGLDIDTGTPTDEIDAKLKAAGFLAVRYTTHSNAKTRTEIRKDEVVKFFRANEIEEDAFTDENMRRYCMEKKEWHPVVGNTVEFESIEHTSQGIMVVISHEPISKNRIIVPLATPFVVADEAKTQKEALTKFSKYPAALAELLGVPFDKSCTDPSRLFYLPRHAKGRPFSISLMAGPLLDRNHLPLTNQFEEMIATVTKKGGKSKTQKGKQLGGWSRKYAHGFQITQVIEDYCPEKLRGHGTSGYNIECPFDDGHSNAGDITDTGCYAVNAAEGANELFIVSCRHESCDGYTNIDMLGKMVEDQWFPEDVLTEPNYDIVDHTDGKAWSLVREDYKPLATSKELGIEKDPAPSLENALKLIETTGIDLAYDELNQRAVIRGGEVPWNVNMGRELNDEVLRVIRHFLLVQYDIEFSKDTIFESCMTLAGYKRFNPVADYLNALKWDGVARLTKWLTTYLGVDDSDYSQAVGKTWMFGAVARAMNPGIKFDTILILEGLQGTDKSNALRVLGGDWFSDGELGDLSDKDAVMALEGVWIQEIAELATMQRSDIKDLKAFVSRQSDKFRRPYGRTSVNLPRRSVFAGTTNPHGTYLDDPTGARRYWPVRTAKIELEALKRDRDQLWAEATALYAAGASITLPKDLWAAAAVEQADRQTSDPWVDEISSFLQTKGVDKVHSRELLTEALNLGAAQQTTTVAKRVRPIMERLGWEYKTSIKIKGINLAGYALKVAETGEAPPLDQ